MRRTAQDVERSSQALQLAAKVMTAWDAGELSVRRPLLEPAEAQLLLEERWNSDTVPLVYALLVQTAEVVDEDELLVLEAVLERACVTDIHVWERARQRRR